MSDVFSNLTAQSLSDKAGIQPLIPPLFAPAPQLLSDITLLSSNDQPAASAETAPFSITPTNFVDGITDAQDREQLPEVASPEKRPLLPDLVPPDVPQAAMPILSIRHLFHSQSLARDTIEPLSPTYQLSAPTPIADEPSSDDMPTHTSPISALPPTSVGASAERSEVRNQRSEAERLSILPSRPLSSDRPPGEAREMHFSASQPIQSQELTPPDSVAPVMSPFFIRHDDQKQTRESSPSVVPTERLALPSRPGPIDQLPLIVPLPAQPSSQPSIPSKRIVNSDNPADQQPLSLVQPQVQPAGIPEKKPVGARVMENEMSDAHDTHNQEIAADSPRWRQSIALISSAQHSATDLDPSPPYAAAPDALPLSQVSPEQEIAVAKEEGEPPLIRITIGRVVVRAAPTAQPTSAQKRVLRPAQSLSEYLKQRERGSR